MTAGQPAGGDAACVHCGSVLRANAPFCGSCGQAVANRVAQPVAPIRSAPLTGTRRAATDQIVGAGRGVRCCCFLLDLAVMMSPALPLAIAAAILGVPEVVYIVVPIAFIAVWAWMQIWQGFTGTSFGKAMLGLRLIRTADRQAPGVAASFTRSGIFAVTAGLAAVPVVTNPTACDGLHDHLTGVSLIDVTAGANPLGPRQRTTLRRSADRSLRKVQSPVPLNATGRP